VSWSIIDFYKIPTEQIVLLILNETTCFWYGQAYRSMDAWESPVISRGPSFLDLLEGAVRIKLSPVDSSIGGLTTGKLDKHLQQIQSWETHYHNGFMIIERPFSHTPRCPWGMDQQCLFQSDTPCCTSLAAGLRQDFFWIPLPIVAIAKPGKSMEHYFHIAGIMRQSSVEWGLIHGKTQKSPKPKHSENRKGTGTHPVETDQT